MSENQKEPQYKLRWSEELRDKVVESAKLHNRSINAEICTRLEESFKKDDSAELDKESFLQIVKDQQHQIDQLQEMVKQLVIRPRQIHD